MKKSEQMRCDYGFVPPFLANPDILLHLTKISTERRQMTLFEVADAEKQSWSGASCSMRRRLRATS